MPSVDELGLVNCQIPRYPNRFALGMIDMINAMGLISDKVSAKCLVIQFLATGFLRNIALDKRSKFPYVADTRF